MRLVTLFLIAAFAASTVGAGSYQQKDGTIVDPLMDIYGEPHPYLGDVRPWTDWGPADWSYADLTRADLTNANLTGSILQGTTLAGADLRYANLTGVDLVGADLTDADLRYANLTGSRLQPEAWEDTNWFFAFYYTDNVQNWNAHPEMDQAWRDSVGILAIDPTNGDINGNGVFDAADYTVWQDYGAAYWANGGNLSGLLAYRTWKDHFGQSIASGSGADHVPEPTTLLLALLALATVPLRVRHG